jgi:Zn-dependent peptidase ImmA (M78 family)/transcriptional regulator with XRE-family HTH domain
MSIAERVRGVIADCRLSQAEFAVVSSIEASKLSKSLNGSRRFTSLELAKIAELGKVTVDYLLTGEASPLAMAARKSIDSPAELASRVGTRFAELREVAAHLGAPTRFDPLPHGALVGREIDRAAVLADRAVRRCAERNLNPTADDLATVIEDAFGVDVAVGPLGDNFDGLAVSNDRVKLIVVSPSTNPGRQRFTLAHELGHLLFGDDQGLHLDQDIYAEHDTSRLSEMRANAFAAAFLMPTYAVQQAAGAIRTAVDLGRVALDFAVTPSALSYRLKGLGLAAPQTSPPSMEQAARACDQIARMADLVQLSSRGRPPRLLARDLLQAYFAGLTTLRPYAEVMGIDPQQARRQVDGDTEGALS